MHDLAGLLTATDLLVSVTAYPRKLSSSSAPGWVKNTVRGSAGIPAIS